METLLEFLNKEKVSAKNLEVNEDDYICPVYDPNRQLSLSDLADKTMFSMEWFNPGQGKSRLYGVFKSFYRQYIKCYALVNSIGQSITWDPINDPKCIKCRCGTVGKFYGVTDKEKNKLLKLLTKVNKN